MILIALKTIMVAGKNPDGLNSNSPVLYRHELPGGLDTYMRDDRDGVNPTGWHPANVSIAPGQTFDTAASGISDAEANDLIANGSARLAPGS